MNICFTSPSKLFFERKENYESRKKINWHSTHIFFAV